MTDKPRVGVPDLKARIAAALKRNGPAAPAPHAHPTGHPLRRLSTGQVAWRTTCCVVEPKNSRSAAPRP